MDLRNSKTGEEGRRRALVTGASRGIGRAIASQLLAADCSVAATARGRDRIQPLIEEAGASDSRIWALPMDLSLRSSVDAALAALKKRWDRVDLIVLNAGTNGPTPLDDRDSARFDHIVEVDLVAQIRLLRELIPLIPKGGRIVAISSVLGRLGIPVYHAYCAAKAGLIGVVRSLALELASKEIAVNAVLPGWVETAMAERSMREQAPAMGLDYEGARAAFLDQIPLGRMATVDEVAALVCRLCSPDLGAITGQAFAIDCGCLA